MRGSVLASVVLTVAYGPGTKSTKPREERTLKLTPENATPIPHVAGNMKARILPQRTTDI